VGLGWCRGVVVVVGLGRRAYGSGLWERRWVMEQGHAGGRV
jgi:hypothetical protein